MIKTKSCNQNHLILSPAETLRANYSFNVLKLALTKPMVVDTTCLSVSLAALLS